MSGSPANPMDFNQRLQEALKKATSGAAAPASAPETAAAPAAASADNFTARLADSLAAARGDAPATSAQSQEQAPAGAGPVGQGDYVVREGDCMSSIAKSKGFFWETLWNDAANQELKDTREDPNVLMAGDRVTIREKIRKDEALAPEQRHRFKRKGEPSKLNLCVRDDGEPVAEKPYVLEIDGEQVASGNTDSAGNVQILIPGNAQKGVLKVDVDEETKLEFNLNLGSMQPMTSLKGVQQRLKNLGYPIDKPDGKESPQTKRAIQMFQADQEIPETGEPDQATRDALEQAYGS
jgi:N-acetylmuramoyl-L-alanine amidase